MSTETQTADPALVAKHRAMWASGESDNIKAKERAAAQLEARGRPARSARRHGVRALRARARRGHLQHRHGADARRRARRGRRRFSRVGGEFYSGTTGMGADSGA